MDDIERHAEAVMRAFGFNDIAIKAISQGDLIYPPFIAALRALEAEVYNRAIEDAAAKASCHGQFSRDAFSRGIMRGHENAANAIRALAKEMG